MKKKVNILGIETSCDETAAAVVTDADTVLSSVVASQADLHQEYGGVVPEIASRAHVEKIYPVVKQALEQSGLAPEDIDAVAAANQPGLTISLIVGVTAAKMLAFCLNKPLIAVNHVHAHLQSAIMQKHQQVKFPAAALIVSGGHSNLYACSGPLKIKLVGRTIDDAAGEAFDKVASILKLPYPGGPSIEKAARKGNPKAIAFPRSMLDKDNFDFSFSGLKTAVLYHCSGQNMTAPNRAEQMNDQQIADIAASFQAAVVEILVTKTKRAAAEFDARTVILGGGVGANTALREGLEQMCEQNGLEIMTAPKPLCTDNAVMIASLAYYKYLAKDFADMSLEVKASY